VTVLVRVGAVVSRRFGFELVKPSSVVVSGGSASATVSALGSVEFTTCETLSLNGVFSSGYDNYMISFRCSASNAAEAVSCRLRLSGTDNATASSYTHQFIAANSTTVSGQRSSSDAAGLGTVSSTQRNGQTIYVYGPNLAQPTAGRNIDASGYLSAYIADRAFTHNQSTAYDGITLFPGAGTVSGRVAVYGMRG